MTTGAYFSSERVVRRLHLDVRGILIICKPLLNIRRYTLTKQEGDARLSSIAFLMLDQYLTSYVCLKSIRTDAQVVTLLLMNLNSEFGQDLCRDIAYHLNRDWMYMHAKPNQITCGRLLLQARDA